MIKTYTIIWGVVAYLACFYLITFLLGEPIKANYGIPDVDDMMFKVLPSLLVAVATGSIYYHIIKNRQQDKA